MSQRQQYEQIVVTLGSAYVYVPKVHRDPATAEQRVVQREEDDPIRPGLVHDAEELDHQFTVFAEEMDFTDEHDPVGCKVVIFE